MSTIETNPHVALNNARNLARADFEAYRSGYTGMVIVKRPGDQIPWALTLEQAKQLNAALDAAITNPPIARV